MLDITIKAIDLCPVLEYSGVCCNASHEERSVGSISWWLQKYND